MSDIEKIRIIIDEICSEYVGRFDFWTTPYGRKILQIKEILNNENGNDVEKEGVK
jgi:hypothetical protein